MVRIVSGTMQDQKGVKWPKWPLSKPREPMSFSKEVDGSAKHTNFWQECECNIARVANFLRKARNLDIV